MTANTNVAHHDLSGLPAEAVPFLHLAGILLDTGDGSDNSDLVAAGTFDMLTTRLVEMSSLTTKYGIFPADIYYYLCKQPLGLTGALTKEEQKEQLCAPFYGRNPTKKHGKNKYDFTDIVMVNHFHLPNKNSWMTYICWIQSKVMQIGVFEDTDNTYYAALHDPNCKAERPNHLLFWQQDGLSLIMIPEEKFVLLYTIALTQFSRPILAAHPELRFFGTKEMGKTFLKHLKECMMSKQFGIKLVLPGECNGNFIEYLLVGREKESKEFEKRPVLPKKATFGNKPDPQVLHDGAKV